MKHLYALKTYVCKRLGERSTWLLITAGISAAAALVWPWSAAFLLASIVMAMVPDNTGEKPDA